MTYPLEALACAPVMLLWFWPLAVASLIATLHATSRLRSRRPATIAADIAPAPSGR